MHLTNIALNLLLFFTALAYCGSIYASTIKSREIKLVSPNQQQEGKRLALIIGNSQYQKTSTLINPENDATDIASSLLRLGFEVIVEHNVSHKRMALAVEAFGNRLAENRGTGLFYYAGHGIQVSGKNYLIPIDADIKKSSDIEFEALNVDRVLHAMANADNRLNIIILDACRDNPFAGSFRRISRGLAQIKAPSGTFLAYATAPGEVASDGYDRNGVYTKHILLNIESQQTSIENMFKKVRQGVIAQTNNQQIPWESSSLLGEFYFMDQQIDKTETQALINNESIGCSIPDINKRSISCLFGDKP